MSSEYTAASKTTACRVCSTPEQPQARSSSRRCGFWERASLGTWCRREGRRGWCTRWDACVELGVLCAKFGVLTQGQQASRADGRGATAGPAFPRQRANIPGWVRRETQQREGNQKALLAAPHCPPPSHLPASQGKDRTLPLPLVHMGTSPSHEHPRTERLPRDGRNQRFEASQSP